MQIFANSIVTLNGTNFKVTGGQIIEQSATVDLTRMGDAGTRNGVGAQTGDSFVLNHNLDSADANSHPLIAAAYANCKSGGTVAVTALIDGNAAQSANNPRYEFVGVIAAYNRSFAWNEKSPVTLNILSYGSAIVANNG
jgi:hypothetical protein